MSPVLEFLDYAIRGNPPGIQRRLVHSWPWSHSISIAIAVLAIGAVAWLYWRERVRLGKGIRVVLFALRAAVILLTVGVLMYGWMLAKDITDLPDLVLVLDDSASMLHEDSLGSADQQRAWEEQLRAAGFDVPSRWSIARWLLLSGEQPLLDRLSARYNVKLYRLAASARLEAAERSHLADRVRDAAIEAADPQYAASRLGTGLRSILEAQRGRPTAAVIMMTDGITTDGRTLSETASYAQRVDVPLYFVGIGNDRPATDVRISDLLAEDIVFVGDLAHFDFKLTAAGYENQPLTIRMINTDTGAVLAERQVDGGADGQPMAERISFRPMEVGEIPYEIEVVAPEGDDNPVNNRLTGHLSVRDETIRVLLVQQYPNFEFRYLKNLIERGLKHSASKNEKAFELTVVLQEADLQYASFDASAARAFPVDRDALFQFDVIIFGDVNPAFFSELLLRNLADFVEVRGGGLILLAGPQHTPLAYRGTPLAELMPIVPEAATPPSTGTELTQPHSLRTTPLAIDSPLVQVTPNPDETSEVWQSMPGPYWLLSAPQLRGGARVLLETPSNAPVVCLQFIGAGKVVMVLTDETYRWARHEDGPQYYAAFWLQTIRYLSRSKLLGTGRIAELTSDKQSYRAGEPVSLRVRFFDDRAAPVEDDGVRVVIEKEGGVRRRLELQRDSTNRGYFHGVISGLNEGDFRAWMAAPAAEEQPPSVQFSVVAPQGEQARLEMNLADLQDAAQISRGKFYTNQTVSRLLDDLPAGRQVRVQSLPPQPLWNSSFIAAVIVALLITEWILRKRSGCN